MLAHQGVGHIKFPGVLEMELEAVVGHRAAFGVVEPLEEALVLELRVLRTGLIELEYQAGRRWGK